MRLTELFVFENIEQDINIAMSAWEQKIRDAGGSISDANLEAHRLWRAALGNMSPDSAAEEGAKTAIRKAQVNQQKKDARKQAKADRHAADKQARADRRAALGKDVDRIKPTITTTPDADRTRQDTLGRNLKADRYYNQLNKTPKGRELIKRAVAKLGVPEPAVDQIIDVIADHVPQAIQQLDNILKNPAAGIRARQARNQST